MLHRLIVENLKGFGPRQEVELAPLTLIYGPNSGGKSTLIQALLLLKQTVSDPTNERAGLITQGQLVNIGAFPAAIHRQDVDQTVRIGITYSALEEDDVKFGQSLRKYSKVAWTNLEDYERTLWTPDERISVEFGFGWNEDSERVRQTETSLEIEQRSPVCRFSSTPYSPEVISLADLDARAAWNMWMDRELLRKLVWMSKQPLHAPERDLFTRDYQRDEEAVWEIDPMFGGESLFPGEIVGIKVDEDADYDGLPREDFPYEAIVRSTWLSLADYYGGAFRRRLNEITYLGPLRRAPERYAIMAGSSPVSVGQEGEQTLQRLSQDGELLERVNSWLKRLQIPYMLQFPRLRAKTFSDLLLMTLTDQRSGVAVSLRDVGFGVSQVLSIVVEALSGASKICIEQPELHLHPRLQAELADLFIEETQTATKKQFLIETHSEALMLRIQRRIRQGVLQPDDVSVLYVDPEGGTATTVKRLRLDRLGRFIDEWPGGFFEERLNETLMGFEN